MMTGLPRVEYCRKCRDELPFGTWPLPRADFILWGKFFDPEALGPLCMSHALRWFDPIKVDQYAVYDLRPINKTVDMEL